MLMKILKKVYRSKDSIYQNEIMSIIKNNKNVILLDVRSNQEYKEGHLNSAINIPVYELAYRARELKDKESIIIVYCNAGIRSRKAVNILKKLGYKNLYNVEDGVRI